MNHKEYKELLYLTFIGEISDAGKEILKMHLQSCDECSRELDELNNLNEYISAKRHEPVPVHILEEARSELRERINVIRSGNRRNFSYLDQLIGFVRFNYSYIINGAASAAAGILIGFMIFSKSPTDRVPSEELSTVLAQPEEISIIRNIRMVDVNPDDDEIEFSFEAVKEVKMKGSVHDARMRGMLMYAVTNGNNPGVRLNSLNVMDAMTRTYYDDDIKNALISAVKYDDNPGVRREALMVLKNFPFDKDIKESYLFVILNDTSSGMRIAAINELIGAAKSGISFNYEEKEMFRQRLETDQNNYIRLRAKTVLEEYN